MSTLILINPLDVSGGSRVPVRVCSSNDPAMTGAADQRWWPAISDEPVITARFFDGDFTSGVELGGASVQLRLDVLIASGAFPQVRGYDWAGAPATIYRLVGGEIETVAVMRVDSFAMEAYALALRLQVDDEALQANVLTAEYAGTTGAEGGADLKGTLKPWVFGRAVNVEPVFIDQVDNVFQVSAYGPIEAISAVYERGSSFGASIGNFANYAALVAAEIPEGRWGTCLAEGMFRLGAPPAGVITCDVDGDNVGGFLRRTGAILKQIATRLSLSDKVDAASLDALDAAVARNVNIVLTQQTSLLDLARRMASPCNATAGVSFAGKLITPRVPFGTPSLTLDAQGRQMPPVLGMARQNTSAPYKRVQMGAARSWRVHTFDEIAFYSELIDRGTYDAATVYREGNIVASADKSRWLYINPTASGGNAPPTWPTASNVYWSNLEPPLNPAAIGVESGATRNVARGTYDNGTTYIQGDEVLFSGSSYRLIVETSTGNAPPDVVRWALLANSGSGPPGADGLPGISVIVSNEAHVVATAADGTGGNYTNAGGQMRLLRGDVALTPTFSIAAATPASAWISINPTTGVYTVSDPGVDVATATLRAAWAGVNYDRTYTLAKSKAGAAGANGLNGTPGLNSATVFIYRRSASVPALPSVTTTYTFATAALASLDNEWTQFPPAGTDPLYVAVASASGTGATDTIAANEWSSPVVLAQNGAAGLNSATVFLYRRSASAPPVPSVTSTYTFATGVLAGQDNSWTQAVPSGTDPLYVITASAASTGATDTIASGEWSTPTILAQNGEQGPVGPTIALVADNQAFTFTDGAASPTSQTITLSALLTNISGTVSWSVTPSVTLGGTGNTRTLSVANFGSNRQVTVEATLGGITDRITIVRLERNVSAPANSNRVPLSRMEGDSGWGVIFSSAAAFTPFEPNGFGSTRIYILSDVTFSAAGQQIFAGQIPEFQVTPGERLSVSSRLGVFPVSGPQPSFWQLYIEYRDATSLISSDEIASGVGNTPNPITAPAPADFSTVPAGADRARLVLRVDAAGAGVMRVSFLEPMVTSAAPGQTVHPPFTPGPVLTGPVDAGGPLLIGQLPTDKAVADLRNTTVTLAGLRSARPVSGAFIGQRYNATDTREAFRWDGFNWQAEADVTATVSGPAEITMQFRADLALLSPLPLTADYQLGVAGASPLTSGVSWSVSVVSGSFTGTAPSIVGSGTGQLRINSALASPEATLRITPSVAGRASPPFVVRVARNVASPSLAPLTSIASSTFAQAHDIPIQITLPSSSSSVSLTAVADLLVNAEAPQGGTTVEGKWQRETSPGTWADVGAAATSSPNPEVFFDEPFPGEFIYSATPGSITCNRTATDLTPGSIQRFRFVARVSLGNVRTVTFLGNASATA